MIERIRKSLQDTDRKKKELVILTNSAVHLNGLIQQSAERMTPRISPTRVEINYSHGLAHPHSFYPLICNPLFSFLNGLGMDYKLKGSLVRQAADNILFGQTTRNLVSYILRKTDNPFSKQDLSDEAIRMYKELLIESDIDAKFSGDMKKNEEILSYALPYFVKRLANLMVDTYSLFKNPRSESKKFRDLGKLTKKKKEVKEEDFSYLEDKVNLIKGPENVIVAYRVIHPNLQVADIFNSQSHSYDVEQTIDKQTGSLIIYVKKVMIRNKMPVYKLIFAVDRKNDYSEPLEEKEIQTIFSVDFSQTFSKNETAMFDNRLGSGVNNHEITGKSIMLPLPILGKLSADSANADFAIEYENLPPSIYIYVPRKSIEEYKKPVALGPDWGKKEDADALETFSRALFHANEVGINHQPENSQFDQESIIRARLRFANLGNINKESSQFESFRYNIIKSFLLSPHRTIEYLGKSGLWDRFFLNSLNKTWTQVLDNLNSIETHLTYQEKIKLILKNFNDRGSYFHEDYRSGLSLIDQALGLQQLFPNLKSHHERIYRLLTN